jgi:hypothetical protein
MSMLTRTPLATAAYRVRFREKGTSDQTSPAGRPSERVPRVARLLALAYRIEGMIRSGELKDWAEAARLIGVTRARMTQIANLMLLAPEIQHFILCSDLGSNSQDPTNEHDARLIVKQTSWVTQWQLLGWSSARCEHMDYILVSARHSVEK